MKMTFLAILIGATASTSLAGVRASIYRADEVTPLPWADPNIPDVYQDIMVGTRLTIFIESDAPESAWSGGLSLSWEDWDKGIIEGRGYNEDSRNYDASVLPASGSKTLVTGPYPDITWVVFDVDLSGGLAGEWAVLDYRAQAVGI